MAKSRKRSHAPAKTARLPARKRPIFKAQCPARDARGFRCEFRAGHKGKHRFPPQREDEAPKSARERLLEKLATAKARREKERAQKRKKLTHTKAFREVAYAARLKTVRRYLHGFEGKQFQAKAGEKLTKRQRTALAKNRSKVNRLFRKLRPYLSRSQKTVAVRSKRAERSLRRYAAFPKLKGLKAIPVATPKPDQTKIKVDKNGRVELKIGERYREKLYLFPYAPRSPDDIEELSEELIEHLPMGYYLIVTSHHDLLPTTAHKDQLLDELRMLIYQYQAEPGFLMMIRGFKWLGHTREAAATYARRTDAARRNARIERRNAFDEMRRIARMHRRLQREAKKNRCPVRNKQGQQCLLQKGHHTEHRFRRKLLSV